MVNDTYLFQQIREHRDHKVKVFKIMLDELRIHRANIYRKNNCL